MILSHAHIDYCGLIPKLVKDGYKSNIYATPATKDLTDIPMLDSAGVPKNDLRFLNKTRNIKGNPFIELLYRKEDAELASSRFVMVDAQIAVEINKYL